VARLHTKHRHFAHSTADACGYSADVVPFAAVNAPADALRQPYALLAPGESTWLIDEQVARLFELALFFCLPGSAGFYASPPALMLQPQFI